MSCCKHQNVNNYLNNGGGSSSMYRKYAHKKSRVSSGNFSINGTGRSGQGYIGNPNSAIQYVHCKINDTSIKTSVKNNKALINSKLFCSPANSLNCYKDANKILVELVENGTPLNKHFIPENRNSSSKIDDLKADCPVDRSNYHEQLKNKNNIKCDYNKKKCNVTKDLKEVGSFTPGYDMYLFYKKKKCNYNPPDAKIIAC
jgi:hypothetical protein